MSVDIQHIAFAVRQLCRTSASPFNLGHAQQLVAAALGYDSLAAHQAAVRQGKEASDLQAASHVVLERQRVLDRAASLGLTASPQDLITWLSQGFQGCLPRCRQHRYDGALEEHIQARLDSEVENDDHVSSLMAETNNDGVDEVYLPVEISLDAVPPRGEVLTLSFDGHVAMALDTERPYTGHRIDVTGMLILERFGQQLYADPVIELERASLDTAWADET